MNFLKLKKIDGEPLIVNSDYIIKMIPMKEFTEIYLYGEKKPIKVLETKEIILKKSSFTEFDYNEIDISSLENFKNNQ
jgi:hypothetical protein